MKMTEAIDYRRYYINYISRQIQDLLKELQEINNMPENIIKEKILKGRIECAIFEEQIQKTQNQESNKLEKMEDN